MAFTPSTLNVIVKPIGEEGLRIFSYRTDDAKATVLGTDYFTDAADYGVQVNDLAIVTSLTGTDNYMVVFDAVDADGNATADEAEDADLAAIAGISTGGVLAKTGDGAYSARTITAGTGVSVSNGSGVDGDPTIAADLPTEAEARAGSSNVKTMTPLRTRQQLDEDGFRSIYAVAGAEAEKAKAESAQDWPTVIAAMLGTGDKFSLPARDEGYPIRSALISLTDHDAPIDVRMESGARIVAGVELGDGMNPALPYHATTNKPDITGSLITVIPSDQFDIDNPLTFVWRGGMFDFRDITAFFPLASPNPGLSSLNLFRCRYLVEGVFFHGGYKTPSGSDLGHGYVDSHINTHSCFAGRVRDCVFIGPNDIAVYISGQITRLVLSDDMAVDSGDATVTVTVAAGHGLTAGVDEGKPIAVNGASAIGGITPSGPYTIGTIDSSTVFTFEHGSTASSTVAAGGGSAVITLPLADDPMYQMFSGQDEIVEGCVGWRCGALAGTKRQHKGFRALFNTLYECSSGFIGGNAESALAVQGKGIQIIGNKFYRTQARPINVFGDDAVIAFNYIQDWGGHVSDAGTTVTNVSGGSQCAAIQINSSRRSHIFKNTIRQTENYVDLSTVAANQSPTGIRVTRDTDYAHGSTECVIERNYLESAQRCRLEDGTGTGSNTWLDNIIAGTAADHTDTLVSTSANLKNTAALDWTPVLDGAAGDVDGGNYGTRVGKYRVAGNLVFFECHIILTAKASLSGNVTITGLPLSNADTFPAPCVINTQTITPPASHTTFQARVEASGAGIQLYAVNASTGALTALTDTEFADTSRISISGHYRVVN